MLLASRHTLLFAVSFWKLLGPTGCCCSSFGVCFQMGQDGVDVIQNDRTDRF